jgi:hypothetical protein
MNVDQVGTSDQASFSAAKIPAIEIHSITLETYPLVHTIRDSFAALRMKDYADTYQLAAAYLAFLDVTRGKSAEAGDPAK